MTTTLLIDADILIHQTAAACEQIVCWDQDEDIWSVTADAREAKQRVDCDLRWYKDLLEADNMILCFTAPDNFRLDVADYYKSNRKKNRKPTIFPELRRYCLDAYKCRVIDRLEADDVMGILATSRSIKGTKIIVSEDKDMLQIPGYIYRPSEGEVRKITRKAADHWFLTQTLTGDSTDGYPGLPGCGPKGAEKVLEVGCWDEVVEAYEKKGLSETEALTQARLARILRTTEYNLRSKKLTLWSPKRRTA
jgi:DNA polymerase-1